MLTLPICLWSQWFCEEKKGDKFNMDKAALAALILFYFFLIKKVYLWGMNYIKL